MTNSNNPKSKIFKAAHAIYRCKKNSVDSFSEALKISWSRYKFWKACEDEKELFIIFKKKSTGTKRNANVSFKVQQDIKQKGGKISRSVTSPYIVTFAQSNGLTSQYRSFDLRNLFLVSAEYDRNRTNLIDQINSVRQIDPTEGMALPSVI